MMAKRALLFFVHEKTDTTGLEEFHPYQRHKIRCGEHHYAKTLNLSSKEVTTASELPGFLFFPVFSPALAEPPQASFSRIGLCEPYNIPIRWSSSSHAG
jgi:hypothetical protein